MDNIHQFLDGFGQIMDRLFRNSSMLIPCIYAGSRRIWTDWTNSRNTFIYIIIFLLITCLHLILYFPCISYFSYAIGSKNLSNLSRCYLSYSKIIHLQLDESLKNLSKSVQICPEAFFRVEVEF